MSAPLTLAAEQLSLAYGEHLVVERLTMALPTGRVTVVVGANACGKSTLLRGLARLMSPTHGAALLDGRAIHEQSTRAVATVLGLLPQTPVAPEGITVTDLVGRGRYPHQGWFRRWTDDDEQAVTTALHATVLDLAERPVDERSGGQRQRVWIAMALAQQTGILLLDEPTTFLDLAHQVEVLDLLTDLNRTRGTTVVMVLHDLNLAARYADHLVALERGRVVASGSPHEVVTEAIVRRVFGLDSRVIAAGRRHPARRARRPARRGTGRSPVMSSSVTSRAVESPTLGFDVEVVAVHRLSPSFVRITLGGECLEDLDGGGELGPRDQRVKLIFPVPGGTSSRPTCARRAGTRAGWRSTRPSGGRCAPTRFVGSAWTARARRSTWTSCCTRPADPRAAGRPAPAPATG
jgi:iron complex transport system ATP-binding protein